MQQSAAYKGCSERWGFCGTLRVKQITRFEYFLLPSRIHFAPQGIGHKLSILGLRQDVHSAWAARDYPTVRTDREVPAHGKRKSYGLVFTQEGSPEDFLKI